MIFRITINDNDFTQDLEEMCERCKCTLLYDMPIDKEDLEKLSIDEKIECYEKTFQFQRWCNEVDVNKLTIDEIKTLEERVKANVLKYLKKYTSNYDYFKSQLKVKFLKSFKPRWENGENVYYFPFTHNIWLSQ